MNEKSKSAELEAAKSKGNIHPPSRKVHTENVFSILDASKSRKRGVEETDEAPAKKKGKSEQPSWRVENLHSP